MSTIKFDTSEIQILENVGPVAKEGKFQTSNGRINPDCLVHNTGSEDSYLVFGKDKSSNKTDGINGKNIMYIKSGDSRIFHKGSNDTFSACTDNGATELVFESGRSF